MKKEGMLFLFAVAVLLLTSFLPVNVKAEGTVYNTELSEGYVTLKERDILEFPWEGQTHRVMVREIGTSNKSVQLTIFIEGAETPFYAVISKESYSKLDFDRDDNPDLLIGLTGVNEKDVTLYLIPGEEEKAKNNTTLNGIAIIVAIILVGLMAYLLFFRKKE
jgi:hypothetical protein